MRPQRDEVVFTTGRNPVDDDVLDGGKCFVSLLLSLGDGPLRLLDLLAQLLGLSDEDRLLVLGRLRDDRVKGLLLNDSYMYRSFSNSDIESAKIEKKSNTAEEDAL